MRPLDRQFWLRHAVVPLCLFVLCGLVLRMTSFDLAVARAWAWNADAARWVGERSWWAGPLLHRVGRDAVIAVLVALALVALHGILCGQWRTVHRGALFVIVTMLSSWALVGVLKHMTGVDCPWDLAVFGGTRPYARLFGSHSAQLPLGACFPGAHSASGFSLFAFYYALRDRRPAHARGAFCVAVGIGTSFALAQEARGAHFLSHDLTSAFLAWFICLGAYGVCGHAVCLAALSEAGCGSRRWIRLAGL